jgi:hypothetical protein
MPSLPITSPSSTIICNQTMYSPPPFWPLFLWRSLWGDTFSCTWFQLWCTRVSTLLVYISTTWCISLHQSRTPPSNTPARKPTSRITVHLANRSVIQKLQLHSKEKNRQRPSHTQRFKPSHSLFPRVPYITSQCKETHISKTTLVECMHYLIPASMQQTPTTPNLLLQEKWYQRLAIYYYKAMSWNFMEWYYAGVRERQRLVSVEAWASVLVWGQVRHELLCSPLCSLAAFFPGKESLTISSSIRCWNFFLY